MGARTTKRVLVGLAVASLALSTSVPAQAADEVKIGFSPISLSIPAMVGLKGGVEAISASLGMTAVTQDPAGDVTKTQTIISSWVTNKTVKGFWSLIAGPGKGLNGVIKDAQQAGIVGVLNGLPEDYGFAKGEKLRGIAFSLIPFDKEGDGMAAAMAECLKKRGQSNGKIIIGLNAAGTPGKEVAEASLIRGLKMYAPKATIVKQFIMTGTQAQQQTLARSALQANPTTAGFVTFTDEGSLGTAAAYKLLGKKASEKCIIGAGGGDPALAGLKAGTIYAVAKLDFQKDTFNTIMKLKTMIANPKAYGGTFETPLTIIKK